MDALNPPSEMGATNPDARAAENQQTNEENKPRSLADIFGDDSATTTRKNDDSEADDPSKPVKSFAALVKRSGLSDEDFYKTVMVPMADGKPLSLGEVKDRAARISEQELREVSFEQRRVKAEGAVLTAQRELEEVVSLLPKEAVAPALVAKMRKNHDARVTRERALTLEHIPEWEDDDARRTDIVAMTEFLKGWGFNENFLPSLNDHRAIKFVRDMYLMNDKIQKALSRVKPADGNKPLKPSQSSNAPRKAAASSRRAAPVSDRDKIMAVLNR